MNLRNALVAMLAIAVPVAANAAPTLTNGNFEAGYVTNTEFGSSYSSGSGPTGWSGAGYALYFSGSNATTAAGNAQGQYSGTGQEYLWATGGVFASTTNHFVALDGEQTGIQASVSQTVTGLVDGVSYDVSFDWGATQVVSRVGGPLTEQLAVSFGAVTQYTPTLNYATQQYASGGHVTFTFTAATGGTGSTLLKFLSLGTPNGLPPIALLDNVAVATHTVNAAVPEPATLTLLLSGIAATGFMARRRRNGASAA